MASASDRNDSLPAELGGGLRIDVDGEALRRNLAQFRRVVAPPTRLMAVVKADGYGHGSVLAARSFLSGGADLLGVHSLAEAQRLRAADITAPLLVLGPLGVSEVAAAAKLGAEITVGSLAGLRAAIAAAGAGARVRLHLKLETGVNRQGLPAAEIEAALQELSAADGLQLVGLSSHFADIEDTTDHTFAHRQMERFDRLRAVVVQSGFEEPICHMSCSAAAILWRQSDRDLVRIGISAYGIWPSRETLVSARAAGKAQLDLQPALTWRCPVAQVKRVPVGETVGYGRTWQALVDSHIAVLPVGYADGYPRVLSGRSHALIHGRRAPVCGRICMNLCMVDVTHIPGVKAGDDAVLLGRQGAQAITVEELAEHAGTIAYEVVIWPKDTWRRQQTSAATVPTEGE